MFQLRKVNVSKCTRPFNPISCKLLKAKKSQAGKPPAIVTSGFLVCMFSQGLVVFNNCHYVFHFVTKCTLKNPEFGLAWGVGGEWVGGWFGRGSGQRKCRDFANVAQWSRLDEAIKY